LAEKGGYNGGWGKLNIMLVTRSKGHRTLFVITFFGAANAIFFLFSFLSVPTEVETFIKVTFKRA
jgi:hypothetical protein